MPIVHQALALGPLDNRTYVLRCPATGEAALVDVGFDAGAAIDAARRLGVTVRWLLATHGHYDHVAGMEETQRALGGAFRLHPADRPLLAALDLQGAAFGFPPARPPAEVSDLADGERVPLGEETLEVIHTPGHSPGGVCFLWGGHLWAGDSLFAGSIGRTDLPGGDFDALERAIRERIYPLGDHVHVHPGHGPDTTIGRERRTNPFVRGTETP
jgi:glyoxylase-like metal-dependent hydrolase (beta-lactamase superfamily II)